MMFTPWCDHDTPSDEENDMKIQRAGSHPSLQGPTEWFTGTVRIDPLFQADDPAG